MHLSLANSEQPIGVLYEFWPRADGTGRMVFISEGAEAFLETTADELGEMIQQQRLPLYGIDTAAFYESIFVAITQRKPWAAELGYRTPKTGRRLWLHLQSYPQVSPERGLYFSGHWIDLTPMKRAEEESRAAYRVLATHLENTPLAVIEWDRDFRIARWSGQAEAIFGWRAEDVLGKASDEFALVHPEDAERVAVVIRKLLTQSEPRVVCANKNLHESGRVLHCVWHNSVVTDSEGCLISILSLVEDHTERVELDQQLFEAHRLESIGLLAGGIAHDFNNLLTIILGHAGIVRDHSAPNPFLARSLGEIDTACTRAAQLCEQITAFAGIGRLRVVPLNLNELIRSEEHHLVALVGRSDAIRYELTEGLPPIRGEVRQLHQVLENLVVNAHEATSGRDGAITIASHAVEIRDPDAASGFVPSPVPGRYVGLSVRDYGCGIPEAIRAKIFEPFFSTKRPGRGLGLAAVRGIVCGYQGCLRVTSQGNEGTLFEVLFPTAEEVQPGTRTRGFGSGAYEQHPPKHGAILVVDDEMHIRELIATLLEEEGYEIATASEAQSALAKFQPDPNHFAAAILDVRMPGLQGPELAARLRELHPGLPVLIVTGFSATELPAELWSQGPTGMLPKPFSFDQLRESLRKLLLNASIAATP